MLVVVGATVGVQDAVMRTFLVDPTALVADVGRPGSAPPNFADGGL